MDEKKRASAARAQAKYNKENTTFIGLRFNNKSDWDIVSKLGDVPSKLSYIRQLIRDDIVRTRWPVPESPAEVMKRQHDAELDAENKKFREAQEQGRIREQEEKEAALRLLGL